MRKLVAFVVVALLVVGIVVGIKSSGDDAKRPSIRAACETLVEHCEAWLGNEKPRSGRIERCTDRLAPSGKYGKRQFGDSYDRMISCVAESSSCGEAAGCIGGAVAEEFGDVERGFDRMTK